MYEDQKEFIRNQLETFYTQQEVCDRLGITVQDLLERFDDKFTNHVLGGDDDRGYDCSDVAEDYQFG